MAAADAAAADPAIAMSAAKVRGSKNTKKAWRKSDIAVRTQGGQRQRYEPELTTTRCQLDGAANAAGRTLKCFWSSNAKRSATGTASCPASRADRRPLTPPVATFHI